MRKSDLLDKSCKIGPYKVNAYYLQRIETDLIIQYDFVRYDGHIFLKRNVVITMKPTFLLPISSSGEGSNVLLGISRGGGIRKFSTLFGRIFQQRV